MKILSLLFLSSLSLIAQVTKPVMVYSTNGLIQWPTNFFSTNITASGGTILSFDQFGRMNISSIAGSGTNSLIQTNGINLGSIGTLNFTDGLTGYVSAGVVYIGNSVAGGGDVTTAQLLVVSNQMIAASNYSFTAIGVTSNKFQTDVVNLQGATNGLHTRVGNLEGATNGLAAQILVVSNITITASNKHNPGGVSTSIQYNDGAQGFGGSSEFVYDNTTKQVTLQSTTFPYFSIGFQNAAGGSNIIYPQGFIYTPAGGLNANTTLELLLRPNLFSGTVQGLYVRTNVLISASGSNAMSLGNPTTYFNTNFINYAHIGQAIQLGITNGGSGIIFSNNGIFRPTNVFVFNVTNPVAGQVFKFHSVTYGGATATIILTNDVDNSGGGGGGSLQTNANQFGPDVVLTIKDGALLTNITVYNFLTLSNSGTPSTPLTNHLVIGKDSYAGRGMLESWDDNRLSIAYQPFLGNNRVHMILPGTTATTVAGYGMVTPVTLGGLTVSQPPPTEEWPLMTQLATPALSNACAGVFSSADMTTMGTRYGLNGYFLATEFLSTNRLVTNITHANGNRLFIGRTSTASPNLTNIVNTTNATGQYAGLYADCGNSAQFYLTARDGTAEFRTNTGIFWRATNIYQFYMMQAPTSKFLSWKLKDMTAGITTEGWFSNNVPTNMMKFGYLIRNGTTVVHSVRFNKMYVEAPLSP